MKTPKSRNAQSLLGGVCAGCLALGASAQAQTSPPPDAQSFVIQSHRGAGTLAPENTLPAFELAWQIGTVPEADVRMTADQVIIAFHDDNFKRLAAEASEEVKQRKVEELSWQEVSKLDVGAWKGKEFAGQTPPRIRDVFQAMKGHPKRWLYLDIKKVELERLAELAREFAVERQLILASPDYELIRRWKALVPESMTLLWMGGAQDDLAKRLETLRENGFKDLTQLQIHVRVGDKASSDPLTPSSAFLRSVGQELRRRGVTFQTLPWHCNDPEIYHRLLDLGVESFATDAPKVTLEAVRGYYEKKAQESPAP